MSPPSFSYVNCSFSGINFILRIETRLLSPAILAGSRIVQTTPAPAFCQGIPAEYFSAIEGNKLYKLAYHLQNLSSLSPTKNLWSHGSAQSNAMLALSALAQLMGAEFHYVLPYLSDELKARPKGNLALALERGMHMHVDSELYRRMTRKTFVPAEDDLVFGEGAHHASVAHGFQLLAAEIDHVATGLGISSVFLPSGTGVSAFHLAVAMQGMDVFTTPVYGDAAYLQAEFSSLAQHAHPPHPIPQILTGSRHYHFGALHRELWQLQAELEVETGIEFDLLYDVVAWANLLENRETIGQGWLYLHQGGMQGSVTMRERYHRMFGPALTQGAPA
ncbi:hypothetical protein LG201_11325 [Methylobacillus gramineus]|uniref:hypothetical protein n=1 Tax=Methylobacillus gramineus TaxID=755169 RepID=UPI001CFFE703|nr:hypothetical protein [Methylobacillus gramineus]MCB5185792.1 hypothetical protein [Methylobacillus gramineus]